MVIRLFFAFSLMPLPDERPQKSAQIRPQRSASGVERERSRIIADHRGSSRIRYAYTVNYSKGDNYYTADNGDGWHVSLKYEGNQIMSIDLDAPPKDNSATSSPAPDSAQSPN